jgi:hypothetical protein
LACWGVGDAPNRETILAECALKEISGRLGTRQMRQGGIEGTSEPLRADGIGIAVYHPHLFSPD